MTLPLLPAEYFAQALQILHNCCNAAQPKHNELLQFLAYIEKTWLPKASKVSVYNCPVRTNNLVENFHSKIRRKLGSHENLWVFLGKISSYVIKYYFIENYFTYCLKNKHVTTILHILYIH